MQKQYTLLLLCLLCVGSLAAQIKVTGTVVDPLREESLIGVTVLEKGTTNGTATDLDGNYEITVSSEDAVLTFTYTGYAAQEIRVGSQTQINVELGENVEVLDEIVVIGYGVQKKSVVTGAISKVSADDLEDQPVTRLEQGLQGRSAGVRVTQSSGQPGAASTVRIRGTATIGNSDPLYIVDGVQIEGGIDFLNPNDIESIEVLKGAAAAAIYGARAGNGVILVTTKTGKAGKMVVNYNGFYGLQNPWRKLNLLNAEEYAILSNEASIAAGQGIIFEDPAALGEGTDWQEAVFNDNAPIQNHAVSFSGGNERSDYAVSFGYFGQEGIVGSADDSNYERFTARVKTGLRLTNWFKMGVNVAYSRVRSSGVAENTEFGSPLGRAINLDPITPLFETDEAVLSEPRYANNFDRLVRDGQGRIYGISDIVTSEILNPVAALEVQQGFGWSDKVVPSLFGEVTIIPNLKFRSSFGGDLAFFGGEGFTPEHYLNASNFVEINSYGRNQARTFFWNFENVLTYQFGIGGHQFNLLAGVSSQRNSGQGIGGSIRNIPVDNIDEASLLFANDPETQAFNGYEFEETLSSVFGRLIYNYEEKYLLTANLRRDGSSKFGQNNLYGIFPSVSAGWVVSEESFFPNNPYINFLKFRGSYGVNGNNRIGNFLFVSTVGGGRSYTLGTTDDLINGVSPNALANPDLRWEESTEINFGLDARLFKHFELTLDYFDKTTDGMLLGVTVAAVLGNAGPIANIAKLKNEGFEVELGYNQNFGELSVDLGGNLSYVENTILDLGQDREFLNGQFYGPQGVELTRTVEGEAIGSFFGYKSDGLFQTQDDINAHTNADGELLQPNARPGDIKFLDTNGDGVFNENDRTIIGDPTPSYTYGITLDLAYKNFDLNMFAQGVWGNQIYNAVRRFDLPIANYTVDALNRWTGPGTSNSFPRLNLNDADPNSGNGNFSRASDFWLEDGSYFRIKTLQLGYTLPREISGKIGISRARLYIAGNNLLTITDYTGLEPEIGASFGVDRGIYPQARFYTFGVNVTFQN